MIPAVKLEVARPIHPTCSCPDSPERSPLSHIVSIPTYRNLVIMPCHTVQDVDWRVRSMECGESCAASSQKILSHCSHCQSTEGDHRSPPKVILPYTVSQFNRIQMTSGLDTRLVRLEIQRYPVHAVAQTSRLWTIWENMSEMSITVGATDLSLQHSTPRGSSMRRARPTAVMSERHSWARSRSGELVGTFRTSYRWNDHVATRRIVSVTSLRQFV